MEIKRKGFLERISLPLFSRPRVGSASKQVDPGVRQDAPKEEKDGKVSPKIFLRICEIYAQYVAGRRYHHQKGDGITELLRHGFARELKKALDYAQQTKGGYLFVNVADSTDLSQPLKLITKKTVWRIEFMKSLNEEIVHPTRWHFISNWRSIPEMEALKQVAYGFDRGAHTLPEFLENVNKGYLIVGGLESIAELRNMTSEEIKKYTSLVPRITDENIILLGEKDKLENVVRQEHAGTVFPQIAGVLSAQSGIPLTFFLPEAAASANSYDLFYQECDNISNLIVRPCIDDLLDALGLSANWDFKSIEVLNEKERAETESKQASTVGTLTNAFVSLKEESTKEAEEVRKIILNELKKYSQNQ